MSILVYCIIYDTPSEVGLDEFNQRTTMTSKSEHKTVTNRKERVIAMLLSPFLWILSVGYLMTLFVKTGVGEWSQLFLMQTIGKSQYDSKYTKTKLDKSSINLKQFTIISPQKISKY